MSESNNQKFIVFRWIDLLSQAGGVVAAVCLTVMTSIIMLEVCLRYLFNSPTTWVGELSIYLFMALCFFSLAYGLQTDSHFSIDVLTKKLSSKNRTRLKVVTDIICFLYSATFIYKGIEMARFAYEMEDMSSGMMAVPLWIPWSFVPIGGLLLCLQIINKIADDIQALKND